MEQEPSELGAAARDLRWYFARTDAGPLKSNFGAMVYRIAMGRSRRDGPAGAVHDDHLVTAWRAGGVARVLRALDEATVDVLWRAFGFDWPEKFGPLAELAALAPLTGAARRAHQRSGTSRPLSEWLEGLVGESDPRRYAPTLDAIQRGTRKLRDKAIRAYLAQRRRIGRHA